MLPLEGSAEDEEVESEAEEKFDPEDSDSEDDESEEEEGSDDDSRYDVDEGEEEEEEDDGQGESDGGRSLPIRYLVQALQYREPLASIRAIVERELRRNPDFFAQHAPSLGGTTPLHDATWFNAPLDVIEYLIEKRPEALRVRRYGRNLPLHLALLGECGPDVIHRLVGWWPASAEEPTPCGCLPLHLAVQRMQGSRTTTVRWMQERTTSSITSAPCERDVLVQLIRAFPKALRKRGRGGQLPLHRLLSCTDGVTLQALTALVEAYPEALAVRDDQGLLPIDVAAKSKSLRLEVLQYLVNMRPTSVRERNPKGRLPIHGAYSSPYRNAQFLVDQWPESLEERDGKGCLPLHVAAYHGAHALTLQRLVERSPRSIRATDRRGRTPLHAAARGGCAGSADLLAHLRPEAVLLYKDADGCLPLHVAVPGEGADEGGKKPALAVVRCLLQRGPQALWVADARGRLPLHHAAARRTLRVRGRSTLNNDLDVTRLVLERGSDALRHQDISGNLPLHAAVASKAVLMKVWMLWEAYPGALQVGNAARQLPVQVALSAHHPSLDVVRFLLKRHPESVRAIDLKGRTLLHLAVRAPSIHRRDDAGFVRRLAEQWPEAVQVRDSNGFLPFHVAALAAAATDAPPDLVYYLARLRPELVRRSAASKDLDHVSAGHDNPAAPTLHVTKKPRLSYLSGLR
jgi:ankyrin repeat protein